MSSAAAGAPGAPPPPGDGSRGNGGNCNNKPVVIDPESDEDSVVSWDQVQEILDRFEKNDRDTTTWRGKTERAIQQIREGHGGQLQELWRHVREIRRRQRIDRQRMTFYAFFVWGIIAAVVVYVAFFGNFDRGV